MPTNCVAVSDDFLKTAYHRPSNGGNMAQLYVQAEQNEKMGCDPYVIVGFDAPRTILDLSNSHDVANWAPLNKKLRVCGNCGESAFWKIDLDGKRIKTQSSANLQIGMQYFGTEEQAPIPYFQFNCDFNLDCGGNSQGQGQIHQQNNQHNYDQNQSGQG